MNSPRHNWGNTPWAISFRSKHKALPSHADVVIIGGGFTGLTAAAMVKHLAPEKSVLLLEANEVGNGASGRTGGIVLAESAAGNLPGLGDVLNGYKKILRELNVKTDLELRGVWEIARGPRSMEGKRIHPVHRSPIEWNDSGLVRVVKKVPGGSVDPGKVVTGLARAAVKAGAAIFTRTKVLDVQPGPPLKLHVIHKGKKRTITAGQILQATNAAKLTREAIPGEPKLTFALATAPLSKKHIAELGLASRRPFYSVDLPYLWGRLLKNGRIVFGSGLVPGFDEALPIGNSEQPWSGLEKQSILRGAPLERLNNLEQRVRSLHPVLRKVRITHRWGGPILLTKDFAPIFRRHPKNKNMILLGGYSGHGVALSVYLGRWAAEALLDKRKLPKWNMH
ncbi:MAG: FAD-binding oxidoreductase [Acidobacteria bacterium]|nr:FAD-binding oxidoreductase [Acidobacteriota bacterium]MBS1864740.1 FAD-binding oxidoreductase [Acidobacteriota bacterium]